MNADRGTHRPRLDPIPRRAPSKKARYAPLRTHAARIVKLAEFPMHVNGAYLDDPDRIPFVGGRPKGPSGN
jgi:hypothetical protein